MIKRKQILSDVAHGSVNNSCFNDKGIPYYQNNGSINHCDKFVTDSDYTYDDVTKTETVSNVHVIYDEHIGNDLSVTNDAQIAGTLDVCGATCIDDTLNVSCAICGCSTLEIDGNTSLHSNLGVDCNTCICGTLDVDGVTTINNNVNITGTTTINGDLHVTGTAFEEHTTDLYVGANFIGLRDCATTALSPNERSGIIINKYDAVDSLGIVTDANGTLRIGEFNTVKVYTVDDVTYYSDREMTIPVTIPAGKELFQIGKTDPTTGLKEYYYVDKDDTEPVATRAGIMNDHQLTCWNASGCDIHTIGTLPTTNASILQYDTVNDCYFNVEVPNTNDKGRILTYNQNSVEWSSKPTTNAQLLTFDDDTKQLKWLEKASSDGQVLSYSGEDDSLEWVTKPTIGHFATEVDYNAVASKYPVGSIIIIDECKNYLVTEHVTN